MPLGEFAAIGSALLWALNSVLVRPVSARLPALRITALEYLCAAVCMLLTAGLLGRLPLVLQFPLLQMVGLVASALVGMGLGDTSYVRALSLIGVARSYPVSQAAFVLGTFGLAVVLLGERVGPNVAAGAGLLLGSVWLIARSQDGGAPAVAAGGAAPVAVQLRNGVAIALFAGVCWAGTTTLLKLSLADADLLAANAVRIPVVALVLNTVGASRFGFDYRQLGRRTIAVVAVAGVVGLWLSSLLFLFAIDTAGAAKTAVLSSTSPLFAAALAVVFLGERLTPSLAVGTLLAVAGMMVVVI